MQKVLLQTPDGTTTFATAGRVLPPPPPSSNNVFIASHGYLKKMYQCGHRDYRTYSVHLWGRTFAATKGQYFCSACGMAHLQKHAIRCALCQLPILPGDTVVLYKYDVEQFAGKNVTHVGNAVIGCYWRNCCTNIGFLAGHWTEKGFKPMFPKNKCAAEKAAG